MTLEAFTSSDASGGLRVVLLLDDLLVPAWIHEMLAEIRKIRNVEIVLVVLPSHGSDRAGAQGGWLRSMTAWVNRLAYSLWTRNDRLRHKALPDAFRAVNAEELLSACPKLRASVRWDAEILKVGDDDLEQIRRSRPDVILQLCSASLQGELLKAARFGVWSLHHGEHAATRGSPPAAWEVLCGEPTTGSMLEVLTDSVDGGQVLQESHAATELDSVLRNRSNCYWKSARFIPRALDALSAALSAAPPAAWPPPQAQSYRPYSKLLRGVPGNGAVCWGIFRRVLKEMADRVRRKVFREQWFIAWRLRESPEDPNNVFCRFQHLRPPRDRYWADPFPVRMGTSYYLFFEEFPRWAKKGRIVVSEMPAGGAWGEPRVVLEQPYHLSYPCVFFWEGQWFMVPESAANRTVELWRSVDFPCRWEQDMVLFQNVKAADSTVVEIEGRLWMFTCMAAEGARAYDELFLFHATNPRGPWTPHRRNPVISDARCARPAGKPFLWNGRWLRPAQDCTGTYGRRMTVREIEALTPEEYSEREVCTIEPQWAPGLLATHTLNMADDLAVIDGCKRRWKFW
jgi:hypothetical protein